MLPTIPSEVFTDCILDFLPPRDITTLTRTSHALRAIALDEGFWRRKIKLDFHLDVNAVAHVKTEPGWARGLWMGLRKPRVYVWGAADNGRLGVMSIPGNRGQAQHIFRAVPYPHEISSEFVSPMHLQHAERRTGIVEMQAGGWCFAARDYDGGVWVWGQLEGTGWVARPREYEHQYYKCQQPKRLRLPCRAESVSQGRKHLLILDSDNLIWEHTRWGLGYHHTSPLLTASNPASTRLRIIQICAGWSHSTALNSAGDIFAWHPFVRAYTDALTPTDQLNNTPPFNSAGNPVYDPPLEGNELPVRWGTVSEGAVNKLPPLQRRPDTMDEEKESAWAEAVNDVENPLQVKTIACGDSFVLALRGNGEVWMINCEEGTQLKNGTWEYLHHLSSPSVRHITASFQNIVAYSPSQVLTALAPPLSDRIPGFGMALRPETLPALQDRGVTSVKTGDYHSLALTSQGACLSWGENGSGQLGIGDDFITWSPVQPRNTSQPTLIDFGRGDEEGTPRSSKERDEQGNFRPLFAKRRFVFSITAAGWHSGALVVDVMGGLGGDAEKRGNAAEKETAGAQHQQPAEPFDEAPSYNAINETSDREAGPSSGYVPFIRLGQPAATAEAEPHPPAIFDASEPGRPSASTTGPPRHLPFIRIGFAGRGAMRGGPASHAQRHWRLMSDVERQLAGHPSAPTANDDTVP